MLNTPKEFEENLKTLEGIKEAITEAQSNLLKINQEQDRVILLKVSFDKDVANLQNEKKRLEDEISSLIPHLEALKSEHKNIRDSLAADKDLLIKTQEEHKQLTSILAQERETRKQESQDLNKLRSDIQAEKRSLDAFQAEHLTLAKANAEKVKRIKDFANSL